MANPYITTTQFFAFMDQRVALNLSGDQNSSNGVPPNIQTLLDSRAAYIDTVFANRVVLPLTVVSPFLTQLIANLVQGDLYMRRTDVPDAVARAFDAAEKWLKDFLTGAVSLPNVPPASQPTLQVSDFINGQSRFDYIYGLAPSPTGPAGRD